MKIAYQLGFLITLGFGACEDAKAAPIYPGQDFIPPVVKDGNSNKVIGNSGSIQLMISPTELKIGSLDAPLQIYDASTNIQTHTLIVTSRGNLELRANGLCLGYTPMPCTNNSVTRVAQTKSNAQDCSLGCFAAFQGDSNLVLYRKLPDGSSVPYWASNTGGLDPSRTTLHITDRPPYMYIETHNSQGVASSPWIAVSGQ